MRGPYPYYGASGVIDSVNGFLFDGTYLLITEDGIPLSRSKDVAFLASGKFWLTTTHTCQGLGGGAATVSQSIRKLCEFTGIRYRDYAAQAYSGRVE